MWQLSEMIPTIGSVRALLGFSLLPNLMAARIDDADVVIRVGEASIPRAIEGEPDRIHPGLEVFRVRR